MTDAVVDQSMCFIGIDGGGTKTCCVVIDTDRRVIGRAVGGPSNPNHVGDAEAERIIKETLFEALAMTSHSVSTVAGCCACMAGIDRPDDKDRVIAWLSQVVSPVLVFNDAVAALGSGLDGVIEGLAVISGTGSIAVGMSNQGQVRCGGWGPLISDDGGGFAIASAGLRVAAGSADGRVSPPSTILSHMMAQLECKAPEQLIDWAYAPEGRGQYGRIAALSRSVVRAAMDDQDVAAIHVLTRAARQLAVMVQRAALKLYHVDHPEETLSKATTPNAASVCACMGCECSTFGHFTKEEEAVLAHKVDYPVVLTGGNLVAIDGHLRQELIATLAKSMPASRVYIPSTEPAFGAALIARRQSGI